MYVGPLLLVAAAAFLTVPVWLSFNVAQANPVTYPEESTTGSYLGEQSPSAKYNFGPGDIKGAPWPAWSLQQSALAYQRSICFGVCYRGSRFEVVSPQEENPLLQCFPCRCERPLCQILGNCCPEVTGFTCVEETRNKTEREDSLGESAIALILMIAPDAQNASDEVSSSPSPQNAAASGQEFVSLDSCIEACPYHDCSPVIVDTFHYGGHIVFTPCRFPAGSPDAALQVTSCQEDYGDDSVRTLCEDTGDVTQVDDIALIPMVTDMATNVTYKNKHCAQCSGVHQVRR